MEETGLTVRSIREQVGGLETLLIKGVMWAKLCFVVAVEEDIGRVRIDDHEHEAWMWAGKEEIEKVEVMTEGQRDVMKLGLELSLGLAIASDIISIGCNAVVV